MSAQEFSSPGEHMASQSSDTGVSIAYRNPNIVESDNVSFGPPVYYGSPNNGGSANVGTVHHSARDIDDYFRYSKKYNDYYMKYNTDMFNSAKDYDMYMSNTAIQRQVEDLKKAGINPILAGRLGGAVYKGVSAPYVNVNPSGSLSALAQIHSSDNSYQASLNEISSREGISKRELEVRIQLADKEMSNALKVANISAEALKAVGRANNLSNEQINTMQIVSKEKIQEGYNEVIKEMNENNITNQAEMNRNSNISHIISGTITAVGLIVSKFINFGSKANSFFAIPKMSLDSIKYRIPYDNSPNNMANW